MRNFENVYRYENSKGGPELQKLPGALKRALSEPKIKIYFYYPHNVQDVCKTFKIEAMSRKSLCQCEKLHSRLKIGDDLSRSD